MAACLAGCVVSAAAAGPTGPAALRDAFERARAAPQAAVFDRPIVLQSTQTSGALQGDVFALVDFPFAVVRQSLAQPAVWCDILILHLNVKYCRASVGVGQTLLQAAAGRKIDEPLADVYWLRFDYRVASDRDDYLDVELLAPSGPLGTSNYHIAVEATSYAPERTLLHMTYAYDSGLAARIGMQAYLATAGHDKVGFSREADAPGGTPHRVGGLRGVLERNTMRYYLAIEAYLGALAVPAEQRPEKRLQDWFTATEHYPQQLHEIDRDAYLQMKRHELQRQLTEPVPAR